MTSYQAIVALEYGPLLSSLPRYHYCDYYWARQEWANQLRYLLVENDDIAVEKVLSLDMVLLLSSGRSRYCRSNQIVSHGPESDVPA
jgi:hypothetical protein